MPSSRTEHSSPFPWGLEENSTSDPVLVSMARLHSWIDCYVRAQLGPDVCGPDFFERLHQRVNIRVEKRRPDELLTPELEEEVKRMLKMLVHEDRLKALRRAKISVPIGEIENLEDPASVRFAEQLETAAEARAFLESIPNDLTPVIRHLYGIDGEKIKSRKEIAKDLGVDVNTLNQQLRRLYEKLRAKRG
jgi:RNA polymerase sigma factor (sigma-70 family)